MAKYRIERVTDVGDVAFYIDNSLQFDTRDEYIYHESLFLPPAALASARNKADIDGLILGGGDGLGLREGLKFSGARQIDLADYDPEVIRFAKEELCCFNKSSLFDPRVSVYVEEASRFLNSRATLYDYIVTDFTFPEDLAGCRLFTQGFLNDVSKRLKKNGIVALNTFSPQRSPEAYWSVYSTLSQAKLYPRPFQINIPSFAAHGYGEWGFFLASPSPIRHKEIRDIVFPQDRRFITNDVLLKAMSFESSLVVHGLNFARIIHQPEDLRALLNTSGIFSSLGGGGIDFSKDALPAEVLKYFSGRPEYIFFSMSAYWKERIFNILDGMDWDRLMEEVEKTIVRHSKATAQEVRAMLERFAHKWKDGDFRIESFQRALVAFLAVIIVMNMLCPDNAFAKGYSGGHSYGSSGSGEGVEISLVAPAVATAFHNAYWLDSLYVPDMAGKAHQKLRFSTAVSQVAGQMPEQVFFALNDTTYLTEQGSIFQLIPQTHFFYKVETGRLVLYHFGQLGPIVELAMDKELADVLERDIEIHRKALAATIKQLEQWLGWAGPADVLVREISDEKKELDELKILAKILDNLHKNIYAAASVESLDVPSVKLAPAIRLTTDGSLILKTADDGWKSYVFHGFHQMGTRDALPSDSSLDLLWEELLKGALQNLKDQDPMRTFIIDKMNGQ